jgi:hypothetical protein
VNRTRNVLPGGNGRRMIMLDEFRDIGKELTFAEDDDYLYETYGEEYKKSRVLGMTSGQRFVISVLLLATIIVVGCLVLLLTEKIWLF